MLTSRDLFPAVLVVLLLGASITSAVVERSVAEVIGIVGLIFGYLTSGIITLRRSRHLPLAERRPWRAIGLALLLPPCGLIVFAILGEDGPVFGPGDVFFLVAYGIMIYNLARLARTDPGEQPWSLTVLDMAVAAVAATAIVWDVVLEDLVTIDASPVQRVGLSLYPILDVGIIVGLCLVAVRRSQYRFDLRMLLLAAAMSLQVVADLVFLHGSAQAASFQEATPVFWLLLLPPAGFLAASILVDRAPEKREFPERDTPLWALIWPYLIAGALVPVHVLRVERLMTDRALPGDAATERVILYALLLVGMLVVVRQTLAIRHNRIRVEQQRRELISSVSHELRTPLTAVVGFLQVMEDDPDAFTADEQVVMMAEISYQAKHMSRTVTDLITLARDGGANLMIRSGEVSLADVIEDASAEALGGPLTSDVDDHLLRVDGERMSQAVGHLISNARIYGGGRIHVKAGVQGGTLTVEVHDDGPGIPTRYLTSIWNQFDRGTRRLDSTSPGLGIGLAIVRAVAAAHGGTAEYRRSDLLGGSCFSITLPANARTGAPWIRELTAR
jgi:signal transduction histidine kinase